MNDKKISQHIKIKFSRNGIFKQMAAIQMQSRWTEEPFIKTTSPVFLHFPAKQYPARHFSVN